MRNENLELELNNNIAFMSVTGKMSADSLNEGLAWIDQVTQANDNFNICVDIAADNFTDLSAAREEFLHVGRVLRHAQSAKKCAVLTDSQFLKNSAKVESAVIPGLEINTFDLADSGTAEMWLKDEPLIEAVNSTPVITQQETVTQPLPKPESKLSENPWAKLDMSKVDI